MALQVISKSFRDDQNRTLSFLLGNSLDFISASYRVDPVFKVQFGVSLQVVKVGQAFTLTSGSWEDYGFTAGVNVQYQFDTHSGFQTVNYINGATLVFNGSFSFNDQTFISGFCLAQQSIEGANISFNLIQNSNGGQAESLIDGEPTRFTVDQLQSLAIGSPTSMTQLNKKSGMSKMTAQVTKIAKSSDPEQGFWIDFRIGFWITPFTDINPYLSAECVKPWISIDILPEYSNPNIKISASYSNLGNTGFVNENFNGGAPLFSKDYIIWRDLNGNILETLDYTQPCTFEAKINGAFTGASKYQFKMFWDIPDVLNLNTDHSENTIATINTTALSVNATINDFDSAIHPSGAKYTIEDLIFTESTGIVTGKFTPNSAFTTYIGSLNENDRKYRLWVRCENPALDYNSSDAMNVELDNAVSAKSSLPLGEYSFQSTRIIGHDGNTLLADDDKIIEDDLMKRYIFRAPKNERINFAKVSVICKNIVNGAFFTLDDQTLNFSAVPILPDGTMPIMYNSNRGFKMTTAEPNRYTTKAFRVGSLDNTTEYGLQIQYPFLARWEYWLTQTNADNDFYGNQNKNWLNYLTNPDWALFNRIELNFDEGSYINDEQFKLRDYDDWSGTSTITFQKLDGTPITGLLANEPVIIIATHTLSTGTATTGYADITIERFENSPRYQITSKYNYTGQIQSPLQPISGQTKATFEVTGATVVSRCLFDPAKLPGATKVKITSRINID